MSSGKHTSDEEFEVNFEFIRNIIIVVVIIVLIVGVIGGVYAAVKKLKSSKTEEVVSEVDEAEESSYPVLGKIVIDKIDVEQPILDSVENEALEEGVIKLYGGALNEERKFLYCWSQQ